MKRNVLLCLMGIFVLALFIYGAHVASKVQIKPDLTLSFELDEAQKNILYYASLAPSSHNAQMWLLEYGQADDNFKLLVDSRRILPATDYENREAYISLGAFLENARQASLAFGYTPEIEVKNIELQNGSSMSVAAAHMRFTPAENLLLDIEPLSVMESRHSDKRAFENASLTDEVLNDLFQLYPVGLYYFPKGSSEFAYIASNTVDAMRNQSNVQAKREELAHWFRLSNEEAMATQDGLPAEQLGITGIKKFFYYFFVNKETVLTDTFAQQGIAIAQNQLDNCAGFFVITGGDSPTQWIRTGMQLESFWLDATKQKIAIHPMSILLEEQLYHNEIQEALGLKEQPQMILRAGIVPEYGSNSKIRRNLADFVILAP